jgi:hypothetical protein
MYPFSLLTLPKNIIHIFRPTEQDTVLDLDERSDDLPALMVWCDVVAKSEVSTSFIANDSCSVCRIEHAVWWLVVK